LGPEIAGLEDLKSMDRKSAKLEHGEEWQAWCGSLFKYRAHEGTFMKTSIRRSIVVARWPQVE
jgi:hypothetical protein